MKKWIVCLCIAFLLHGLAGCTPVPNKSSDSLEAKDLTFDIGAASEINIKAGLTGDEAIIADSEFIQKITDNINSLRFEKAAGTDGEVSYVYMLTWFDAEEKQIAQVTITEENGQQINADGYYYNVGADHYINVGLIAEMLNIALSSSPAEEELRIRFPQYYDLITPKGLEVYVWQTADNVYYCGLLPGTNRGATEDEITDLAANGATVEEMKVILSSYDDPYESMFIVPCIQPTSNYTYQIDDAYIQKVNALFDK